MWGLAWGTVLGAIGTIFWAFVMFRHLGVSPLPGVFFRAWFRGFIIGAIAGIAFSALLAAIERRRSVGDLSITRLAFWGGIGAMLFAVPSMFLWARPGSVPIPFGGLLIFASVFGALGAGSATVTLMAARRGVALPRETRLGALSG